MNSITVNAFAKRNVAVDVAIDRLTPSNTIPRTNLAMQWRYVDGKLCCRWVSCDCAANEITRRKAGLSEDAKRGEAMRTMAGAGGSQLKCKVKNYQKKG